MKKDIDYHDFIGIVTLLIINSTISFIEENNAGNAAALMARLTRKAKALRNGKWSEEDASVLVPGDIISIKLGDIVPADARLLEGDPLKIDQSALTGESLPVTKNAGDGVYSGSTCKQGEIEAVVIATGVHTFFGKAAHLVESTTHVGHFQKVLTAIGNFCICSIAVGMVIDIIVMITVHETAYRTVVDNLLVLLIGGIPIAMPTVLSVTMAIGSHRLSQQGAITKRMTAIEEMAGIDVLCSDKTGTLTLNKLTVDKSLIEVKRVLKSGAKFLCLTLAESHVLGLVFSEFRFGWKTSIQAIPQKPSMKPTFQTFMVAVVKENLGAVHQIISLFNCSAVGYNANQIRALANAVENENNVRNDYSSGADIIYSLEDLHLGVKGNLKELCPGLRCRLVLGERGGSLYSYKAVLLDAQPQPNPFLYP